MLLNFQVVNVNRSARKNIATQAVRRFAELARYTHTDHWVRHTKPTRVEYCRACARD
jgi:hypothetical protein